MTVVIVYFSQTGNTEKVARAIQGGIESAKMQCDILKLRETTPEKVPGYDLIGIGAPSFFFKEPVNVSIFINSLKSLPGLSGQNCFIFSTSAGHPGNILPSVAQKLERVGLRVIGSFDCDGHFIIPHRCVPWYTEGHPDDIDLKAAAGFGMEMVAKSEKLAKGLQAQLPKFEWLKDGCMPMCPKS